MNARHNPGFEERWRQRFERYGAVNDDDAGIAGWSPAGLAARFRRFAQLWRATDAAAAGHAWLDAGCGAGTYTRFLAAQLLDVTAVDYSAPTTRKARDRSPPDVRWAVADVTRLPFHDASFDGALCFGVMQALESPQAALRELRRVLRPGGVLWVDALNGACVPSALSEFRRRRRGQPRHLRYDSPRAFGAALRAAGYDRFEIFWVPIMPAPLRPLQSVVESAPLRGVLRLVPPLGLMTSHSFLARARASGATA